MLRKGGGEGVWWLGASKEAGVWWLGVADTDSLVLYYKESRA